MKTKKTLFKIFGISCLLLIGKQMHSQPIGCQVFKNAQAPIYYSAENLRSDTFDILTYTINLEVGSSSNQVLKGNTKIRFAPKLNNQSFIFFDLLQLTVDSIKENNSLLTYSHISSKLKVNFLTPKNIIDTSIFTVYYGGQPAIDATGWGGFYFDNTQGAEYAYNLGVGFGAAPHNYGRVWFPCFDNFVEKSKYQFNITCDTARRAYCNGVLTADVVNGLKRTRKWVLNEQIPTYLASVSVAKYAKVNWAINAINGNKPIDLVAFATDTTAVKNGFVNLKNCVTGFENYFGPYMWNRVGYCIVPFSSGAMEHATNITYPKPFIGTLAYESDLMAHELSHHWWGDLVTCETQEDMWINEGMATFSSYMFLEWQYGKKKYLDKVKTQHDDLLHFLHKKESGFRAISGVPHSLTYGTHVYTKGADVAHTLRSYMGDVAFFAACKYLMTQRAYKNVNSSEMKTLFQTSSGQNLNDFFNNWVFAGGWPHFAVDSVKYTSQTSGVNAVIAVKQKLFGATNLYNTVPLEISFFKNDWSVEVRTIVMSGATGSFTVSLPFTPAFYALNYDSKISDASSHEAKVIKTVSNVNYLLGKVFFKVQNKGADSSLIRVTHNYVKPDPFKTNPKNHRLSNQHFWKIEGILSPGFLSKVRFNYDGTKSAAGAYVYLDTALTIFNGDSVGLFYRPNAAADWTWLRNATKQIANAKTGTIEIDSLMLGEYTFGNVGDTTTVGIKTNTKKEIVVRIFPNPVKNSFKVEFETELQLPVEMELSSVLGDVILKKILRTRSNSIELQTPVKGSYLIKLSNHTGWVYSQQLLIE
jgi:hypothetical protein